MNLLSSISEQAYLPSAGSGGIGKCYSASRGSRQQSRNGGSGRKRLGPGWNDTATIVRDKRLDRPVVSIDSNDRLGMSGKYCLWRECTGTRSESPIHPMQACRTCFSVLGMFHGVDTKFCKAWSTRRKGVLFSKVLSCAASLPGNEVVRGVVP